MDFSLGSTSLSSFVPTLAIPSLDIIIVAGIFIVFLFDALRSGAAHAGAVTLSLAVLYVLQDAFLRTVSLVRSRNCIDLRADRYPRRIVCARVFTYESHHRRWLC